MFKKTIYVLWLLLLPLYVFPISWEIETDFGITIELRDETSHYNYLNKYLDSNYEFVEAVIKNENSIINFRFDPGTSKALFIDKKESTYRARDIYWDLYFAMLQQDGDVNQGILELLKSINLGYKESAKILLVMPDGFDFFRANIFKIQFGFGLYIEYYKKTKEIVVVDEYDRL